MPKHLEILPEAGVVRGDKRGQQVFYHLELTCVSDFIACLDGVETGRRGRCSIVLTTVMVQT